MVLGTVMQYLLVDVMALVKLVILMVKLVTAHLVVMLHLSVLQAPMLLVMIMVLYLCFHL